MCTWTHTHQAEDGPSLPLLCLKNTDGALTVLVSTEDQLWIPHIYKNAEQSNPGISPHVILWAHLETLLWAWVAIGSLPNPQKTFNFKKTENCHFCFLTKNQSAISQPYRPLRVEEAKHSLLGPQKSLWAQLDPVTFGVEEVRRFVGSEPTGR